MAIVAGNVLKSRRGRKTEAMKTFGKVDCKQIIFEIFRNFRILENSPQIQNLKNFNFFEQKIQKFRKNWQNKKYKEFRKKQKLSK